MDKEQRKVPRSIPVLVVLLLTVMYSYAAFIDQPAPEKCVKQFYNAYFNQDYDKVAEQLSVFWSATFLPGYEEYTSAQLLENRDKIVKETAETLSNIEGNNKVPEKINLEILKDYTQEGEYSALVAYSFKEGDVPKGMELSILIKESGEFKIFNLTPVNLNMLEQIKNINIDNLDKNFADLLAAK